MLNIGPAELLVVLVVALLVLGPNKLPDAARQVGRAIGEMRKLSSGFQAEMRGALKEPVESKPRSGASTPKAAKTGGSLASPRVPSGDLPQDPAGDAAPSTTDDTAVSPAPSSAAAPDVGSARPSPVASPTPAEPGTDGATAT